MVTLLVRALVLAVYSPVVEAVVESSKFVGLCLGCSLLGGGRGGVIHGIAPAVLHGVVGE